MAWLQTSMLHHVQSEAVIFPHDSKHFVDMPVKTSVHAVLEAWHKLEAQHLQAASGETAQQRVDRVKAFVTEHFGEPGSDMDATVSPLQAIGGSSCKSSSWDDEPEFLKLVTPPRVRAFGLQVHRLWKVLYRQVDASVVTRPECHTLLPLPNPFVIPGDRFREVYYWDSYWIMRGLMASGLQGTAVGMLDNLLFLAGSHGFVPNGARVYYLNRSQPPLLSSMVALCCRGAPGPRLTLLERALPALVLTWDHWTRGSKSVVVQGRSGRRHRLSRYSADWERPRPESYREDAALAAGLGPEAARQLFRDVASAAESGWDFSSRWLADGRSLATIRTTRVVPADLNGLLHLTACHISEFAGELGDTSTAERFRGHAAELRQAMDELLWSEADGCWQDLLLLSPSLEQARVAPGPAAAAAAAAAEAAEAGEVERAGAGAAASGGDGANQPAGSSAGEPAWTAEALAGPFASGWVPLWCGCCEAGGPQARAAVAGLKASGLIGPCGILTSLNRTGQQWDAPNAWAPLQHLLIEGLGKTGLPEGEALASELASKWIETNMLAFEATGHMHEKYDATQRGGAGGGGEYEPQVGFGWSNGVVLDLLKTYPNQHLSSANTTT